MHITLPETARLRCLGLLLLIAATGAGCQAPSPSTPRQQHTTWMDYGGGPDQSKFVALDQITKENVGRLEVAWTYATGDEAAYQFNPLIVDSVMYVLAKENSLVALDLRSGKEIWIHAHLRGLSRRGINYWESPDRSDRRLLFTMGDQLQAIDARTGQSIRSFGEGGIVDLRQGLGRDPSTIRRIQSNSPGQIFEDLILLGSSTGEGYLSAPGHLRAYNVVTGERAWIFHTIPQPGEFGYDTWPKDAYTYAGGVNAWGDITVDEERGIAYVPLGSPTYDYYGADRTGSNLFGNCLLALDARTGERLWHFQTVHHDLWDYDLVAAPQLITVNHNGRSIDAVAQATKQGFLFVFDRVTGEPLWPIEERPVPASEMPGEEAWPTQPFPTGLPVTARQTMTVDDLTPLFLTPEERAAWEERVAAARKGLYTPPSLHETVAVPGAVGGTNWGNTASNPDAGILYVLNQDFPSFYQLEPVEPPAEPDATPDAVPATQAQLRQGAEAYAAHCQACHGADRAGGSAGPSLRNTAGLTYGELREIVSVGRGRMPPIQHIDDATVRNLALFLSEGGPSSPATDPVAAEPELPEGPVVAWGGADPQPPAPRGRFRFRYTPYPDGVEAPAQRYRTDYGLGHPYIMAPPWSTIMAIDLNTGRMLWKKPLGQDRDATAAGAEGTGVPRGTQRNGMLVTATGLVFSTAKDGKVYAFDADTGDVLWAGELPMGTEGLPSMYELDGRQYLVVNATTPLTWGRASRESGIGAEGPRGVGGYVVFALPE